ncbi:hypothetical protein OG535_03735 [Kitasatospora sp. NBC_00085]|uniref:hypothetical protein n=1 Tax=unclassified Kitasatospora TaxID=2633591 RepID=UPI002F90FB2C
METSRITGDGPDGHEHTVRIVARGPDNTRYVVCEGCGYRKRAGMFARAKAEQHLSESHDASGFRQQMSPWPIVLGVIGVVILLVFAAGVRGGH